MHFPFLSRRHALFLPSVLPLHSHLFHLGPLCPALHMDNQSTIKVARNPEHHGKMKHIDTKYYWIRDQVDSGHLKINWVPSVDNCADIFTKALSNELHQQQCSLLGLRKLELD